MLYADMRLLHRTGSERIQYKDRQIQVLYAFSSDCRVLHTKSYTKYQWPGYHKNSYFVRGVHATTVGYRYIRCAPVACEKSISRMLILSELL